MFRCREQELPRLCRQARGVTARDLRPAVRSRSGSATISFQTRHPGEGQGALDPKVREQLLASNDYVIANFLNQRRPGKQSYRDLGIRPQIDPLNLIER